jgi:hypothetical protein
MSGKKRITVDQAVWREATQAAARLRVVNRDLPRMLEALRSQQQEQADRAAAAAKARQDEVDGALASLSEQTRKLELETSRRLRQRAALIRNEMADAVQQVRQETRRALEDQERRFQQEFAEERQERTRAIETVRGEVAQLRLSRDQALRSATALAADARVLNDAINASLPHERFAPGQLEKLGRRLDVADLNLARGLGEGALTQFQELVMELGELRVEVELRSQEWQVAHLAAAAAITVLQEQINLNTSLDVTDEDGAPMEGVKLDVDFWSEGELAELRTEAAALAKCIAATEDPPALADLRAILEHDVPTLDERLTAIVGRAHARQLASQARVNLAELVVNTLEQTTGYVWEDGQAIYANSDERRAFYSKLRSLDDSEIVVEVAPDESRESCVLRILSYDAGTPDEEEQVRRAHAIVDSLRARGLEVGAPSEEGGRLDPALADFERLRQPLAAAAPAGGVASQRRVGQERG